MICRTFSPDPRYHTHFSQVAVFYSFSFDDGYSKFLWSCVTSWTIVYSGNAMTVLCSSVSIFGILGKNVIFVKRGRAGNVLGHFIMQGLKKICAVFKN